MQTAPFRWRRAICASELAPTSRLVAHVLAVHMNAARASCFPGMATIARESGLCRRSVVRAVQDLEARGYIAVVERGGTKRSGKARSNSYEARFPTGDTVAPVTQMHRCPDDTNPVTQSHPPGDTESPEVVMELSIEQQRSQATEPEPNTQGPNPEGARKARAMMRDLEHKMAMASADR